MPCADCGSPKPYGRPCVDCGGVRNRQSGGNRIDPQKARDIRLMLTLGRSVRTIAADLGLSKVTVGEHRKAFLAERGSFSDIMCPCGEQAFHRGWCQERLKHSPARQAFLRRWLDGRERKPKLIRLPPRVELSYPFAPTAASHGSELILLVNGMVPRGLPEQLRGDVCQEIIACVLAGEFTEAEIPLNINNVLQRVRREQEGHYMTVSLDSPRRDGKSWHDVLAEDDASRR